LTLALILIVVALALALIAYGCDAPTPRCAVGFARDDLARRALTPGAVDRGRPMRYLRA